MITFLTNETPAGGYENITADFARTKVQFSTTGLGRCVTIADYESAILASGISGTDDIDMITVATSDEPSTIKIYVDGLSENNANLLMTYLSKKSIAGTNLIYSE